MKSNVFFIAKGTSLSYFAWRSVGGSNPQSREGKNSKSLGLP